MYHKNMNKNGGKKNDTRPVSYDLTVGHSGLLKNAEGIVLRWKNKERMEYETQILSWKMYYRISIYEQ